MHERTVSVRVAADGSCTLDALNFSNNCCKAATEQILTALAAHRLSENDKPEARIARCEQQHQKEANR